MAGRIATGVGAGGFAGFHLLPGVQLLEVINQRARLSVTLLLHQPQHRSLAEKPQGDETADGRQTPVHLMGATHGV